VSAAPPDDDPRRRSLAPNLIGAGWVFLSALSFTAMMTLVKFLGEEYPAAVQSAYRQAASLVMISPLLLRDGKRIFVTSRPWLMIGAMALSAYALVLSLSSYQLLQFAEANALSFTRMLWLVPLAAMVLREPIDRARGAATIVGFLGVLVMLHPDHSLHLGLGQIIALAAAFVTTAVIVAMKLLASGHRTSTILAYSATIGFLFSLVPALFFWRWPTWHDLAILAAMGALGVTTQATYYRGLAVGAAAAIVPVDYTRLPLTALVGWLLFHEVPSLATIVGGGIVIVATLFISWHELRVYRAAARVVTSVE
jgi:drug/metabolite transporter (DMT)-like permease